MQEWSTVVHNALFDHAELKPDYTQFLTQHRLAQFQPRSRLPPSHGRSEQKLECAVDAEHKT